ncbi:hypothetical protein SEUCBS139899_004865 [Sporothrix eucalyptigena]
MGTPLRQISGDAIHALAVVLSLPPDRLERIGTHQRAQPAASWLSEQEARIPGLPSCLQIPSIPHLSVKVAQVAKRVIIAASGGADTLAAKAACKGINVDAVLHPCATPTVLCPAHRGLHPTVLREIFFYLSREVADHADFVRRHPCGENDGVSHNDNCSRPSREVHDWGLRMMGISALWCTAHTFRALEKGRQASVSGYHIPRATPVASSSASASSSTPAPHIRSSMRLPHLAFPCEACVIAAVGARSQNLIDIRASMLSRMALDASEKARRAQRMGISHVGIDKMDNPERHPNLWALVDTYIDLLGNDYGESVAEEIRLRSVTLAQTLFRARACEARRQRHHARLVKKLQAEKKSTRGIAGKRPPRMVTNRGHRLPLPLVPLDADLWAHYESVVGDVPHSQQQEAYDEDAPENQDELYFVVQDSKSSLQEGVEEGGNEEKMEKEEEPSAPNPPWEEDYRRNVLESQTVFSSVYDRPQTRRDNYSQDEEEGSYVTISVHTQQPPSHMSIDRLVPPVPTRPRLSTIPGTPITPRRPGSSVSASRSTTSASSSHYCVSRHSNATHTHTHRVGPALPPSPPLSNAGSFPPAPASSVYSQATQRPCGNAVNPATKMICKTVVSARSAPPSSSLMRPTASSRSHAALSTAFVSPSSVRTPTSAKSYVAMQADLAATYSRTTARSTVSRTSQSSRSSKTSQATQTTKTTRTTRTTMPSTASSRSRELTLVRSPKTTTPKTTFSSRSPLPYKAPSMAHSMAQQSAIPTPLFSPGRSTKAAVTPVKQLTVLRSAVPSTVPSAASPAPSQLSQRSGASQWPSRGPAQPASPSKPIPQAVRAPLPSKSNTRAALWAASTPSRFSMSQPPSLEPLGSLDNNFDACSVVPEDSISVIATQRFLEEMDGRARGEAMMRERRANKVKAMAPLRNLNHYQPGNSRRPPPPQAQAPQSHFTPRTPSSSRPAPPRPLRQQPPPRPSPSSHHPVPSPRVSQDSQTTDWPAYPMI